MSERHFCQNEDGDWIEIYTVRVPEQSPAWVRPTLKQMESLQMGLWKMTKEDLQLIKTLIEKYGE